MRKTVNTLNFFLGQGTTIDVTTGGYFWGDRFKGVIVEKGEILAIAAKY